MKRLGLTLVAAVCLTATTFAAGNQPTTAKWEGNINITKLSKYLNLEPCLYTPSSPRGESLLILLYPQHLAQCPTPGGAQETFEL